MRIDLHLHTYYSDGTMSPTEIVQEAKLRGLEAIAITDHNKIEAWPEFQEVANQMGIIPIKGVEINAKYKNQVLHILAYGFKETSNLMALIYQADLEMQRMSEDLVSRLEKEDSRVSLQDYRSYVYDCKKGGWKGIHYLFDRGITQKLFDGFKYYKMYECDFPKYDFPQLVRLCEAIKESGGYSVLAHPGEYYKELSQEELNTKFEALRKEGIQGIECYYPTHSELLTQTAVDFCQRHNLLITVGSDEHGEFGKAAKVIEQTIGCVKQEIPNFNIEILTQNS